MLHSFKRSAFVVSAGSMLLLIPAFFARAPQKGSGVPDGGMREVLVSIFIPSLPNIPFTAIVNTEWIRPLADFSRITLTNHRLIARDRSGRIFQERRLLVAEGGKQESIVTQTEISDPVSHERYICVPRELVCQLEVFQPAESALPAKASAAQKRPGSLTEEALGARSIAGLETVGTRETTLIPAGTIGNDSPLHIKREYWYSRQLGLNALSILDDPRFGTQTFELSDVTIGEPDAKLFVPPEGSKILDLRNPPEVQPAETVPKQ
jgi:hypothetical protein